MKGYDYVIKRNAVSVKNLNEANKEFKYMLPCGHKNGMIANVWPESTNI